MKITRNQAFWGMIYFCVVAGFLFAGKMAMAQEDWPPRLEKRETLNFRETEWFTHGARAEWGAANSQQTDRFAVSHPNDGDALNRPLCVMLHSAGGGMDESLQASTRTKGADIYRVPHDFYTMFLDCKANASTDWWWGGLHANEELNDTNRFKGGVDLQPVEKRVIDTIRWVITKYDIDPNRVYLCGNSMGGSGTLGIGLRHGDLFAAIKANVPAGVKHAACRMKFPLEPPFDATSAISPEEVVFLHAIPDPPICVDYSAPNDDWSNGHEVLFAMMKQRRYAFFAYWGNFGHANDHQLIGEVNDLIDTFDWLAVRKDRAYPVFTNASTDDAPGWPDRKAAVKPGQVNAYFRWTNVADESDRLEIALRLVSNEELGSKIFTAPSESTADVSLRRLQKMEVAPNEPIRWRFGEESGEVRANDFGLITIPKLTITAESQTLKLEKMAR